MIFSSFSEPNAALDCIMSEQEINSMRKIGLLALLLMTIAIHPALAQDPLDGVEHNEDWTPIIQEFDGVPNGTCAVRLFHDGE